MSTPLHTSTTNQGDTVSTTHQNANTPATPNTGLLTLLTGLLPAKGTGAPIRDRPLSLLFVPLTTGVVPLRTLFVPLSTGASLSVLFVPVDTRAVPLAASLITFIALFAFTATPALAAEPPTITESSVKSSGETTTTANVEARVNPGGEEAGYVIEYGPSTSYSLSVAGSIPAGSVEVSLERELTELKANTEYHWRLVVKNLTGSATSVDHTFVYSTEAAGLPDGRAYEMVTPPQKNGALIGAAFIDKIVPEVSESGDEVMATTIQCFADSEACTAARQSEGEPFAFTRTSSGWETQALAPPVATAEANTPRSYNPDAGTSLFAIPRAGRGREDFYGRQANGEFDDIGPITEKGNGYELLQQEAATSNFSHLVYDMRGGSAWPSFDPSQRGVPVLYEYEGSNNARPRLVSIAPGSDEVVSVCGAALGAPAHSRENGALSEDGQTVFFSAAPCLGPENGGREVSAWELYARFEHARSELISTPSPGVCESSGCRSAPPGDAMFQGASSDGTRVFFTDTQQLTDGASEDGHGGDSAFKNCDETAAGTTGCNLYESECPARCQSPSQRRLIDVSADESGAPVPGGPRVQGVMADAADGSHVYFVADGVLTATPNSERQLPVDGQPNLYVYERDTAAPNGHTAFIATLSSVDTQQWEDGSTFANVTPDGRILVFTSHRGLTRDDPRVEGPAQVYRYDAQTATLVRVSVGEEGFNDNGNDGLLGSVGSTEVKGDNPGDANILDAFVGLGRGINPLRGDPTMSNDGSYVFFQSPVGLTPQASNDVEIVAPEEGLEISQGVHEFHDEYAQNVYEYHAGRVSLISDGRDGGNVGAGLLCPAATGSTTCLFGTDASGSSVFFTTADSLVPSDTDTQVDFYDARICTGADPCIKSAPPGLPPCAGETCHGTPAATPSLLTPGSVSFNGEGNLAASPPSKKVVKKTVKCKRGLVKNKKNKCVKVKRKQKKANRKGRK